MLPDWLAVGFTGHRDLPFADRARTGIDAALEWLVTQGRPLWAISSAASGSDTIFIEEVSRRGIPLVVMLPFGRARFRQDFAPGEWDHVAGLITRAIHVTELGEAETAEAAYLDAGVRVVDEADVVVAVWNGEAARGLGGTADVVGYARVLDKPLLLIDPATGRRTEERLDRISAASGPPRLEGSPRQAVERQFADLDAAASGQQPRVSQFLLYVILLHLAAAAAAVLAFVVHDLAAKLLIAAEVSGLVAALALSWGHQRAHHTWIRHRIGAELCRSFLATWPLRHRARLPARVGGLPLERLYRSLRMAWLLDRDQPGDLHTARARYLSDRVAPQLAYFNRQFGRAAPRLRTLKVISSACTVLAIVAGFTTLFLDSGTGGYTLAKITAIMLPLMSAAVISWVVGQDYARRAVRYREMIRRLEDATRRLEAARTWNSLTAIAMDTEDELLRELTEWHSVSRFAGPH